MPVTPENIQDFVNKIIKEIEGNLELLASPVNERQIYMAFEPPIRNAFKTAKAGTDGDDKKKLLYKKLAARLHPDKLGTSQEAYAQCLRSLLVDGNHGNEQLVNIPFQIVSDVYNNIDGVSHVLKNMASKPSETMDQLYKQIIIAVHPIYNEYMRYPEPIRSIVNYARLTIFSGIAITSFFAAAYAANLFSGGFALVFLDKNEVFINIECLNFITNHQYENELDKNITHEKMASFAREKLLRLHGIDAYDEEDEKAIELYRATCINTELKMMRKTFFDETNQFYEHSGLTAQDADLEEKEKIQVQKEKEEEEKLLKTTMKAEVTGMECLCSTFNAFMYEITKPFPGGLLNNLISGCIRVLQALLMVPWLALQVLQQVSKVILSAIFLVAAVIAAPICLAVVFISNIPLYAYDAVQNGPFKGNAFFSSSNSNLANNPSLFPEQDEEGCISVNAL